MSSLTNNKVLGLLKATSVVHGAQSRSLLSETLTLLLIHLTCFYLRIFPVSR